MISIHMYLKNIFVRIHKLNCLNVRTTDDDVKRDASFRYVRKVETLALIQYL